MEKIRQVVIQQPYQVAIQEAPLPSPGPDEVLLQVLYGGICGSDLSVYKGTMAGAETPRIAGHEFSARVAAVGSQVTDLEIGTLVTANPYFNCGTCYSCRRGLLNCCISNETSGVQRDGVFRDYIIMPRSRVYEGIGLSPKTLALVEPFCIGYRAVKRLALSPGERVLVVGGGTIGMMAAIAALSMGAEVTLCDIAPAKLSLAQDFGIQHTILNDGSRPLAEMVADLTGGDGYDAAVEAVGLNQTMQNCIDSVAYGGRIVLIGLIKQPSQFTFDTMRLKFLTMMGSRNALREDFEEAIQLFRSGRFPMEKLISQVFPVEQSAQAFDFFAKNGATNFKIMLEF